MGQYTKVITFNKSNAGSTWTNPFDASSDNTSSYAHTASKLVFNGTNVFIAGWSTSHISSYIPSYATVNSITASIVVRVHSSGSGKIENIKYAYAYSSSGTPSSYPYSIGENGFGTSWTTVSFSLAGNLNSLITSGLVLYAEYTNRSATVQYIDIATIKITVVYTVPDITYTYKDWDGTTLKTQTVEQGTSPTAPSNPTRDADAEYTYTFSGWSLSGYVYTAQYTATKRSYTVTADTDGNGTAEGGGTYEYGTSATLTATPNSGYKFKQWSDGSTDNPRTVTVTGDAAYTAEFRVINTQGRAYIGTTLLTSRAYVGTAEARMFVGTTEITVPHIAVQSVTLEWHTAEITVGVDLPQTVTVLPSNASDSSVVWSTDSDCVSITPTRLGCTISGVSEGTATVTCTATDGGISDSCTVTVNPAVVLPTSIRFGNASVSVKQGATKKLTVYFLPTGSTAQDIVFSAENSNVTLDADGTSVTLTGVTVGTCKVTATTADGTLTASCSVTVLANT